MEGTNVKLIKYLISCRTDDVGEQNCEEGHSCLPTVSSILLLLFLINICVSSVSLL